MNRPLIVIPILSVLFIFYHYLDPEIDWRLKIISPIIRATFYACGIGSKSGTFSRSCASITQIPVRTTDEHYDGIRTRDLNIPNYFLNSWKSHPNLIPARVFEPSELLQSECTDSKLPLMIFFHGGGYAICSSKNLVYDLLLRMWARTLNVIILSIDYHLAPEYPFPAALYDVCSSFQWVNRLHERILNNDTYPDIEFAKRIDFDRIISIGDSAGANLAYRLSFLARDHEIPIYPNFLIDPASVMKEGMHLNVKYQILLFPGTGLLKTEDDLAKSYFLDADVINWFWESATGKLNETEAQYIDVVVEYEFMISPKRRAHRGLPDALIISGYRDPLHKDAMQFAKHMKDEGVNVTLKMYDSLHVFHLFQFLKESQDVYRIMEDILRERKLTGNHRCKMKN